MAQSVNINFSETIFMDNARLDDVIPGEDHFLLSNVQKLQISKLNGIASQYNDTTLIAVLLGLTSTNTIPLTEIGSFGRNYKRNIDLRRINTDIARQRAEAIYERIKMDLNLSSPSTTMLGNISTLQHLQEWLTVYKKICSIIFDSVKPTKFNTIDASRQHILAADIISAVNPYNLSLEDKIKSISDYLSECYLTCKNLSSKYVSTTSDIIQLTNLFMYSYLPYFIYEYISKFIRVKEDLENSPKPESFVVRQFAIIVFKMYLVQTLLHLHFFASNNTIRLELRSIILSLIESITLEYNKDNVTRGYFSDIMVITKDNENAKKSIEELAFNTQNAKINMEKAILNENLASSELSRSKTLMYVWLALLLLTIVICVVVYIVGNKTNGLFNYMFIYCGIISTAVIINGLVNVIRST